MTNEEWMNELHNELKRLHKVKNWKGPDEIGKALMEWVAKHPRPALKATETAVAATGVTVSGVGNLNKEIKAAQTFYRIRRTGGFLNLAALLTAGAVTAEVVGIAVLTYFAEEAAKEAIVFSYNTVSTAMREASTPSTKAQCLRQYNQFLYQRMMTSNYAQTGILPPTPTEKQWFESTFGIRYDILK